MRSPYPALVLCACLFVHATRSMAAAQEPASQGSSQSKPSNTRELIDGAKHPEQVPDVLVISLVMRSWSLPPEASENDERVFRALTTRLKLSPADYALLRDEMRRAHPQLTLLNESLRGASEWGIRRQYFVEPG